SPGHPRGRGEVRFDSQRPGVPAGCVWQPRDAPGPLAPAPLAGTNPATGPPHMAARPSPVLAVMVVALLGASAACKAHEAPQVAFLLSGQDAKRSAQEVRSFERRAAELGLRVVTLAADHD